MSKPIIEFKSVSFGYGHRIVLENLNFTIYEKDFIGIVGPNGTGKTTLLRTILGILKPKKGEIVYKHSTINTKLKFGYVPQIQMIDEIFPLTVYEIVLMGRYSQVGLFGKVKEQDKKKVISTLNHLGIETLVNEIYRNLSGGLRQRVLLARALVCEPDVLILDEPTNDLDLASEKIIMDLIKKLYIEENITVIMVSHLLNVVINYVGKIAFINSKEFEIQDIKQVLTEKNLTDVYNIKIKIGNIEDKKVVIAR